MKTDKAGLASVVPLIILLGVACREDGARWKGTIEKAGGVNTSSWVVPKSSGSSGLKLLMKTRDGLGAVRRSVLVSTGWWLRFVKVRRERSCR